MKKDKWLVGYVKDKWDEQRKFAHARMREEMREEKWKKGYKLLRKVFMKLTKKQLVDFIMKNFHTMLLDYAKTFQLLYSENWKNWDKKSKKVVINKCLKLKKKKKKK